MFYVPRLELEGQGRRVLKLLPDYNIVGSHKSQIYNSIILADESIVGKHCLLFFNLMQNTTEILDLASDSGTFVDNKRLPIATWKSLEHGQKVMFGTVEGIFLTECEQKDPRYNSPSPHEDPTVLLLSQNNQYFTQTKKILVPATQYQDTCPEADQSMEHVTLSETQLSHENSRESVWDSLDNIDKELDKKLDALSEPMDGSKTDGKSFKIVLETQESPLTQRHPQDHYTLPETQAPRNLSENFYGAVCEQPTQIFKPLPKDIKFPDIESQNLLADFGEYQKPPEKSVVKVDEVTVIEKKALIDVTHCLMSLDDGEETDCEDELSGIELKTPKKLMKDVNDREGSVTPELEELHEAEKTSKTLAQLQKLNGNANIYNGATQEMPKTSYDIPTQALPYSDITQPFERKEFHAKDSIEAYLATTQVNINPIEQRNVSLMRLSEISSDDLSQSSQISTPPCAIKLPNAADITKFLQKNPTRKRKASVQNLFPESSDEEDSPSVVSEAISTKTPTKKISAGVARRLKQINILDSPDSALFEPEIVPCGVVVKRIVSKKIHMTEEAPTEPSKSHKPEPPQQGLRRSKRSIKKIQRFEYECEPAGDIAGPKSRGRPRKTKR